MHKYNQDWSEIPTITNRKFEPKLGNKIPAVVGCNCSQTCVLAQFLQCALLLSYNSEQCMENEV